MASPFEQTLRALSEPTPWLRVLPIAGLLLLAWGGWMWGAEIAVRVAGPAQVEGAALEIGSKVGGRLAQLHVSVGDEVEAGQLLLELEATDARLAVEAAEAELAALEQRADSLDDLQAAREANVAALEQARGPTLREAEALHRSQRRAAEDAAGESEGDGALAEAGVLSSRERGRSEARAEELRWAAEALERSAERARHEADGQLAQARAALAEVLVEQAALVGAVEVARAELERRRALLSEHRLLAPEGGRVAAIAALSRGQLVSPGVALMRLLPAEALKVVAMLAPGDAIGRVQPGQAARLRVDGFPWLAYGSVPVRVDRVAEEALGAGVRVELSPLPGAPSALPLQHGMQGQVEVEVEAISPAALLLRSVGRRADAR
ncbi:MAG: HlyD family efflux transporter periplasmic adaptor subunit [Alphaproteobacteria bacterium]|nr:HlyD family efflux transporter periplasmic adaptor subunit [Alphaproteobacteria bacterium]